MTDQLTQLESATFKPLSKREGEREQACHLCPDHPSNVRKRLPQAQNASSWSTDDLDRSSTYLNARWIQESRGPRWWIVAREPSGTDADAVYAFLSLLCRPTVRGQIKTIIHIEEDTERARQVAPWLNGFPAPGVDFIQNIDASDTTEEQIIGFRSKSMRIECIREAECIKHTFKIVPFRMDKSKAELLSDSPIPADGQHFADSNVELEQVSIAVEHLVYYGWRRNRAPESYDKETLRNFFDLAESSMRRNGNGGKLKSPGPAILMSAGGCNRVASFIDLASNSTAQSSKLKLQLQSQMDRANRIPGRH